MKRVFGNIGFLLLFAAICFVGALGLAPQVMDPWWRRLMGDDRAIMHPPHPLAFFLIFAPICVYLWCAYDRRWRAEQRLRSKWP